MNYMEIELGDRVRVYFPTRLGDRVRVYFPTRDVSETLSIDGEVVSKACATGDCWIIRDDKDNLHYVQQFEEIIRYALGEEPK